MIDLHFEERIFESYVMRFKIPYEDLAAADLAEDAMVEYEGEKFFIKEVEDSRSATGELLKSIEAEAFWMKLADFKRPGDFILSGITAEAGLTTILDGTGWTIIECTTSAETRTLEATDASVLSLIWQWAKIHGVEVKFDNRTKGIHFVPEIGTSRGLAFRYSSNLVEITRISHAPEFTRVYPIGKDDLTITTVNGGLPYLEDYSYYTDKGMTLSDAQALYRKDDIYVDQSIAEASALLVAGEARMAIVGGRRITYDARVVDLAPLLNIPNAVYYCGDRVYVYDEPLEIDEQSRVIRTVKWPHQPDRNEVEFAIGPIPLPDTNARSQRTGVGRNWDLFHSRNETNIRLVREGVTVLGRIQLRATEDAEWILSYKMKGVAVGSGTLTVTAFDDEELTDVWSDHVIPFTDGQAIDVNFSFGRRHIPAGTYLPVIRAVSDTPGTGVDIEIGDTSMWVLARGVTREGITLPNSITYNYNGNSNGGAGSVQTFTVPDDVNEILVEMAGSAGLSGGDGVAGQGTTVIFKLAVTAGEVFDVYVGGNNFDGNVDVGGWPNGGNGGVYSSSGRGGGGATYLIRQGLPFTSAIAVAPGGGSAGGNGFGSDADGGDSGFYYGQDGTNGGGLARDPGKGATQWAPGAGGNNGTPPNAEDGDTDGQGHGGDAVGSPGVGTLGVGSGGGGGGWHGGGGGRGEWAGGGGGAGMATAECYDLEFMDANVSGQGSMTISWEVIDNGV